jgi:hypothetical protein
VRRRVGAEEGEAEHEALPPFPEGEHRFGGGEVEARAGRLRGEAGARVGLAGVRDEGERERAVGAEGVVPGQDCTGCRRVRLLYLPTGACALRRGPSDGQGEHGDEQRERRPAPPFTRAGAGPGRLPGVES